MKNASRARDENSFGNIGKNDLSRIPQNSKKSRKALSGGRYNLKHFVTARAHQFAHNALQRFQHGCGLVCQV
ncbi:hypothetical protein DIE19_10530 [Burkholderia sp. Bp9126]|nr:hypothetical protein DIE19_10530 [Burkholderia sp. Bp9126]